MNTSKYVQYGCLFCAPQNWRNFDASPTLFFERIPLLGNLYTKNDSRFPKNVEYGDIVKGLPVADESCKAAYCSHVLEHLALSDFSKALSNTYKILEDGGTFRLVLPDLEYLVHQYINDLTPTAAIRLLKESSLGKEARNRGIKGFITEWLGHSQHLWMWDFKSLKHELDKAGFSDIRKADFGDFSDPAFKTVEDAGRWKNCLGIECRKSNKDLRM